MHPFLSDEEPSLDPPVPVRPNMRQQFHPIFWHGGKGDECLNPGWRFDRKKGEPWDPHELGAMELQRLQIESLPDLISSPRNQHPPTKGDR